MGWNRKLIIPGFELQRDEERGKGKGERKFQVSSKVKVKD